MLRCWNGSIDVSHSLPPMAAGSLELACQNFISLPLPPWLLSHLFLMVNKPTVNSNGCSQKTKTLSTKKPSQK